MLLLIAPAVLAFFGFAQDDRPATDIRGNELTYRTAYDGMLLYDVSVFRIEPNSRISASESPTPAARRLPSRQDLYRFLRRLDSEVVQFYAKCSITNSDKLTDCDVQSYAPRTSEAKKTSQRFLDGFRFTSRSKDRHLYFNRATLDISVSTRPVRDLPRPLRNCVSPTFCGIPTIFPG